MIAYLEPAQFLGTLVMGFGLGLMAARAYDAVRHQLRMKRIRRNVTAYAAVWAPFLEIPKTDNSVFGPDEHRFLTNKTPTKTSGPEAAPANRDPQEPTRMSDAGVAVPSAATGEGAPPARSFTRKVPWDGEWHTDWTDGR